MILVKVPITPLNNINRLVLIIDMDCVVCEVGTEVEYKTEINVRAFRLSSFSINPFMLLFTPIFVIFLSGQAEDVWETWNQATLFLISGSTGQKVFSHCQSSKNEHNLGQSPNGADLFLRARFLTRRYLL